MHSVADSYRYAARLTRAKAKTFYYTFWFLPRERRQAIYSVYAFSRRADDAVDAVEAGSTPAAARSALAYLRSFLSEAPPPDPLVPALRQSMERFGIPRGHFEELLAGMEMDLVKKSYETFDELYHYCYRAAAVIGLICIEVFGYEGPEARDHAIKLGIAMQLTNILRDIKEDQAQGRTYLPEEDLKRFGYTRAELARGVVDERFRELMKFEVRRARDYFAAAEPLFPLIRAESRYCPILLMRFYRRILARIERQGYDVIRQRPALSWHEKLRLTGATWLEACLPGVATLRSHIQKDVT